MGCVVLGLGFACPSDRYRVATCVAAIASYVCQFEGSWPTAVIWVNDVTLKEADFVAERLAVNCHWNFEVRWLLFWG